MFGMLSARATSHCTACSEVPVFVSTSAGYRGSAGGAESPLWRLCPGCPPPTAPWCV
jgi:hypothetical protein